MLRCTQRRCAGALDHISQLSFSLQPKSCRFRPACEMQSKAFMRALRRSGSAAFPRNIRVVQTAKRHRRSRCLNWVEKLFSKERPLLAQSGRRLKQHGIVKFSHYYSERRPTARDLGGRQQSRMMQPRSE